MTQEQIDAKKIIEELNSLRKRIDEIEIAVAKSNKDNVLKEMFGSLKFSKSGEKLLKDVRKDLESKWME